MNSQIAPQSSTSARDPFDWFADWFAEAGAKEPADHNAMTLATVDVDGAPSARMVLLKGVDPPDIDPETGRGFVFYTNFESRKGVDLAANPRAALLFHWKSLRRQIRIEGAARPVPAEEADAYFASRERGSQIGAWASDQSRPLPDAYALEKRVARFTAKFHVGTVPRPPHWSGYRVVPARFEFWNHGTFRLHERTVYHRDTDRPDGWNIETLFP